MPHLLQYSQTHKDRCEGVAQEGFRDWREISKSMNFMSGVDLSLKDKPEQIRIALEFVGSFC